MKKLLSIILVAVLAPNIAQAAITFVDSCEASAISGADVTLTLPATEVNDLVIVSYAIGDNDSVDFDMIVTSPASTFTEVADVHAPTDTLDGELGVYWDITDDSYTQVTVDGLGGTDAAVAAVCMVFRGVDTTTPMDVTPTTAALNNTMHPDPPSIDHNNPSGVWTVIAGMSGHSLNTTSVSYTFPTGYNESPFNAVDIGEIDTSDVTVGMGYRSSGISDPEDPGTMTHSGTDNAAYVWAAATIALRPQAATAPAVNTNTETNVTTESGTINGEITAGDGVTVRGFAWGTDSTLATVIATTTDTAGQPFGAGTFSQNLSGLLSGVTYYFRAYATNPTGTGFGSIDNFVTGTDTTPGRALRLFEGFLIRLFSGKLILYQQ